MIPYITPLLIEFLCVFIGDIGIGNIHISCVQIQGFCWLVFLFLWNISAVFVYSQNTLYIKWLIFSATRKNSTRIDLLSVYLGIMNIFIHYGVSIILLIELSYKSLIPPNCKWIPRITSSYEYLLLLFYWYTIVLSVVIGASTLISTLLKKLGFSTVLTKNSKGCSTLMIIFFRLWLSKILFNATTGGVQVLSIKIIVCVVVYHFKINK